MSSDALAFPFRNSIPVNSSSLATVAYDYERGVLQVHFLDRTVYQYLAVPRRTYEEFAAPNPKGATSTGIFEISLLRSNCQHPSGIAP
jgi:hypothetical protein